MVPDKLPAGRSVQVFVVFNLGDFNFVLNTVENVAANNLFVSFKLKNLAAILGFNVEIGFKGFFLCLLFVISLNFDQDGHGARDDC